MTDGIARRARSDAAAPRISANGLLRRRVQVLAEGKRYANSYDYADGWFTIPEDGRVLCGSTLRIPDICGAGKQLPQDLIKAN